MTKTQEYMDKYWICDDCAAKKQWKVVPWPVTCTSGYCGHCLNKMEQTLTPVTDFTGKNKKAVWD